ncbi:MAG: hypothetical protein ABF785_08895 [Acetobacter papayae]|uniref:hypothetical protein n=1 Tax=Acetobacter papayae TaxID=1076592 RepID=UPI0039EB9BAC
MTEWPTSNRVHDTPDTHPTGPVIPDWHYTPPRTGRKKSRTPCGYSMILVFAWQSGSSTPSFSFRYGYVLAHTE